MDPREVGKASAIAAGTCGFAALFIAPQLFWFGVAAGIAAGLTSGYVSYDFRKVLWAIPIAWDRAKVACGAAGIKTLEKVRAFFRQPHPFGYGAVVGGLVLELLFVGFFIALDFFLQGGVGTPPPEQRATPLVGRIGPFVALGMLWFVYGLASALLLKSLTDMGAQIERCYWRRRQYLWDDPGLYLQNEERRVKEWREKGYHEVPFTHQAIYYLAWVGFRRVAWNIFAFLLWRGWVWLGRGACWLGRFVRRFGWELFRLIHCQGRVASALYGTAGGVTGLFVSYPYPTAIPERALLVFFCALLGFAFGRGVACELVARRWLGLPVRS